MADIINLQALIDTVPHTEINEAFLLSLHDIFGFYSRVEYNGVFYTLAIAKHRAALIEDYYQHQSQLQSQ